MADPRTQEQTVDFPAIITRKATFVPKTVNEEDRTVELTWTTGARVLRGFWDQFWEELSLDPKHVRMKRINNGAPFLNGHCGLTECVVGVIEEATLEEKRGRGKVRFAKAEDDPEAEKIFRKIKDGILQNVSVGYRTYKMEELEAGKDGIRVLRAIDWEPYEFSVVGMGADDGAGFRSAETEQKIPCVLVTRTATTFATRTAKKDKAMADDENDDENGTPTPAAPPTPAVAATRAAKAKSIEEAKRIAEAEERARQEERAAERLRSAEIRKIAKRARLGDAWAETLIDAGTTVEEARAAAFEHMAAADQAVAFDGTTRFEAGEDEAQKFVRGTVAWLYESAGVRDMIGEAAKKFPDRFKGVSLDGGEFRGMKLYEIARKCLERRNVSTRGMSQMQMVGLAFTHRQNYQTIGDFPIILETTMNKSLLAAYALQEDTWSMFCRADTVADFRPSNRYRTGSLTALDVVPEHAEFTNKTIPDGQKLSVTVQTYGNIVGLSRQTIINDDLGALTDMAVKLGRAGKLTIENAVYALINQNSGLGPTQGDSQPFFHANRANVNSTGSALSAAGIDADRVVMAAQKDINNVDFLDLRPSILLVPSGLGAAARVLNGAPFDPLANVLQKPNPVQGLFRTIVDTPRLTGSTTRRYILCDPSIAPIIVVAFLEGQGQAPTVDSENGWRIDGVEWKVRLDAKAQMFDAKGGVTNAGV